MTQATERRKKLSSTSTRTESKLFSKWSISILLLLMTLPAFNSASIAPAAVTTMTSFETHTSVTSSVSYSSYAATTSYVTSTEHRSLYSGPFSIDPTRSAYGCIYDNLPFTVKRGDQIVGQIASNSAIDFYLMSEDQFQLWLNRRRCSVAQQSWIRKQGIVSYSIDWTVPQDGQYEFVFLNFSAQTTADVEFDVGIANSSSTTVIASTVYSFTSQVYVLTSLVTMSSVYTQQVEEPISQYGWLIGVIAALIVVVAAVLYRRRSRPQPPLPAVREGVGVKSEMFCRKCGAKIPGDSAFCLECGTKVA
jgi:hypothetical protein